MAVFDYEVIEQKTGKKKKGSMDASGPDAVRNALMSQGMVPVSISKQTILTKDINISIGAPVSSKDLAIFCRQFSSILNAGVTLVSALEMLYEQSENKNLTAAIRDVQTAVEKGESLAEGMRLHSKIFPEILINMVESGEASGSLDVALDRMTVHFEKSDNLKRTVKNAMIYPIVVVLVSIGVIAIMMITVIPNFVGMFDEVGGELPKITVFVMGISNFMVHNGILILIALILLIIGFIAYKRTPTGSYQLSVIGLKLPIFGKLIRKSASATFTRTMSTLLASGISLIDAVEIVSRVIENKVIKQSIMEAKDEVERGVSLSEPLENSGQFPPMVYRMIRIGEETGNMESMMDKVADFYEEDVESATKAMTTILEPLIIIILAVVVGVIMLAVLSPMFALYSSVSNQA